jgi:hypothetical protein
MSVGGARDRSLGGGGLRGRSLDGWRQRQDRGGKKRRTYDGGASAKPARRDSLSHDIGPRQASDSDARLRQGLLGAQEISGS